MIQIDAQMLVSPNLDKEVEKVAYAQIEKILKDAVVIAKDIVPVRTGFLRDSIGVEGAGADMAFVAKAPYASDVENGSARREARPFMLPALLEAINKANR